MALKLADTAKPMGVFPVAEAVDIEITKEDETKKSLQAMYDDGELGGESLPVPESSDKLLVTVENEGELEWQQVDKDEVGSKPFIGTTEEWESLTTADKEKYDGKEVIITDDYVESSNMYTETHTVTVTTSNWNAYLTYADFDITLKKPLKDVANTKIFMQVMDSDQQAGGHCIKNFTANTVSARIITGYQNARTKTFDVVLLIVTV